MELLFLALLILLMAYALGSGYPVAFALPGSAIISIGAAALCGWLFADNVDAYFAQGSAWQWLSAGVTNFRGVYWEVERDTLIAIPLFIFMGIMLQRSKLAEDLLLTMAQLFGPVPGGLGISVVFVGALLAATTGIVGATVVAMGLISLPVMTRNKYADSLSTGIIASSGTLGQIIPPSIALVILGDALAGTYSQSQMEKGNFLAEPFSVIDLFAGALLPGLTLVALYIAWLILTAILRPETCPPYYEEDIKLRHLSVQIVKAILPPAFLVVAVLGSILGGLATPTEAASFGGVGATLLAAVKLQLNMKVIKEVIRVTTRISCMVFSILLGASLFSLTFRGFGGDKLVHQFLTGLPGGFVTAMAVVMLVMFLLGFVLDFIEIVFIVVPIVAPALFAADISPVWLGVMMAMNLQTSFLTPPFGFSLFYLRSVAPDSLPTTAIMSGVAMQRSKPVSPF